MKVITWVKSHRWVTALLTIIVLLLIWPVYIYWPSRPVVVIEQQVYRATKPAEAAEVPVVTALPAPGKKFLGGGSLHVPLATMYIKKIDVITANGNQRVDAIVDGRGFPIVVKPGQAPPAIDIDPLRQQLEPCAISTELPGQPVTYTPVWVVVAKSYGILKEQTRRGGRG